MQPPATAPDEILARARAVLEADAAAVAAAANALDDGFLAAARLIAGCPGKLLVTGSGTSGSIAQRAAHLFSVAGTPAFHLSPSDGLHGGLGVLRADDLVLALSKGGASAELNGFCRKARALAGGLIAVTAAPDSELARMADHRITLTLPEGGDLGGVIATASSLATAAITDALAEVARVLRGYPWEAVLSSHPAGAVGRDASSTLARLAAETVAGPLPVVPTP